MRSVAQLRKTKSKAKREEENVDDDDDVEELARGTGRSVGPEVQVTWQ